MTRSLTIVNTSNHEGEDYEIKTPGLGDGVNLKPGESITFSPAVTSKVLNPGFVDTKERSPVSIRESGLERPKPFMSPTISESGKRKDRQVFPRVKVEFE